MTTATANNSSDVIIAPYDFDKEGNPNGPNPTQQKILDWVDKIRATPLEDFDHIPVLYVQGGNGSGKTRGILAAVVELLLTINLIRILWGRLDFRDIKLSVMDKFFEVMPSKLIKSKSEQYHYYDYRQPNNGVGRIYFSGVKDLSGLGSQEFAVIVLTEVHELTEQMYRTLKRRCRQAKVPCMILMESEPPNQTHWLEDVTNPTKENYDPDITKWVLSTYENWDNLSPAYKGSMESMPEAAKRKYLFGHSGFSVSGKPFYDGYDHNIHAGEFEYVEGKPLDVAWDFGFHFPAVLVTQDDQFDRWVWLREKLGRDITIHKFADQVITWLNDNFGKGAIYRHYCDPAGNQNNDKSEETSIEILQSKGINPISKQSTYRTRKEIIEGKLSTIINSKPALLVDKRYCPIACDGFMGGYHYPEHKSLARYSDGLELPFEDGYYEHVMNCGEYIAVNRFKAVQRSVAKTRHPRGRV